MFVSSVDSEIDLSIVIVNSDGTQDTSNCIASIYQYPPRESFELILVDNCSRESCLEMVSSRYPKVRTFQSPVPQGFAKNYNLGIRQSHGQCVMILNNDTTVHADALNVLLDALRSNAAFGMVGPQLLSINRRIQTVCARNLFTPLSYALTLLFLDLGLPTGKLWDRYRQFKIARLRSGPVPCISGACMLLSHQTLDKIGLLDEGFDFYFEDVEWCHRVQKHGLQVAYIAESQITHLGDQSLGRVKERAKKSEYLSAVRYFRQYHHLTIEQERLLWLIETGNYLLRMVAFAVLEMAGKHSENTRAYRNLWNWILQQYPKEHRVHA